MSIELMAKVWKKNVSGTNQAVLLCLADHANDDGVCWPSIDLIAWKIGVSEKTVRRAIDSLVEQGALEKSRRFASTNVYSLKIDTIPSKEPYVPIGHIDRIESIRISPDIAVTAPTGHSCDRSLPDIAVTDKPSMNHHNEPSLTPLPPTGEASASPTETPVASRGKRKPRTEIANSVYAEVPFKEFWKAYPRKACKQAAALAWRSINPGPDLFEKIMLSVKANAEGAWKSREPEFIPHAATFLNQRRWDDEQEITLKQATKQAASDRETQMLLRNLNYAWMGQLDTEKTAQSYEGRSPHQKFSALVYAEKREEGSKASDYCWTVFADENGEREIRSQYYGRRIHWDELPSRDYKQFLPSEVWY